MSPPLADRTASVEAATPGRAAPTAGCDGDRGAGPAVGRPRDERVTLAIVDAALRQLDELGYARMSMESVASEAAVSRATVYRRFRDKADLVTTAIVTRGGDLAPVEADDPLELVVDFLEQFDGRFAEPCLEVIGCLLASREEPHAMALHRQRVVTPRTGHLRALLARAVELGQLAPDADLDLAVHLLAGAVLARRVAGVPAEPGWARRAVDALRAGLAPRSSPGSVASRPRGRQKSR